MVGRALQALVLGTVRAAIWQAVECRRITPGSARWIDASAVLHAPDGCTCGHPIYCAVSGRHSCSYRCATWRTRHSHTRRSPP